MAGERVLVVEDNEKNMKLFRDVLEATGYSTLEATTGEDAIELALSQEPALVLMDVQLPGIDGVEALARLRRDERTASIPVLALTAQAMSGDRERFLEVGFDGYLSKPIDVVELIQAVGNTATLPVEDRTGLTDPARQQRCRARSGERGARRCGERPDVPPRFEHREGAPHRRPFRAGSGPPCGLRRLVTASGRARRSGRRRAWSRTRAGRPRPRR